MYDPWTLTKGGDCQNEWGGDCVEGDKRDKLGDLLIA